jgi:uncharacterized protein (TIGR03382 family)
MRGNRFVQVLGRGVLLSAIAGVACASSLASAQVTIPAASRVADIPAFPGDGLTAKLWYDSVNSIAAAEAVITSRFSDTAFLSTQGVDYPQGPTDFLQNDGATLADFLGTDADFLPFDPTTRGIASNIYLFTGYFAAEQGESLRIGVGSDDGFRLRIGGIDLGSANDRGFAFTFSDVTFEASGLYPITIAYYANNQGQSGILFAQETAAGISPVPVERLHVVPSPGALALVGLAGLVASGRRRK